MCCLFVCLTLILNLQATQREETYEGQVKILDSQLKEVINQNRYDKQLEQSEFSICRLFIHTYFGWSSDPYPKASHANAIVFYTYYYIIHYCTEILLSFFVFMLCSFLFLLICYHERQLSIMN